jgi:CHAT domain-containing protein
MRVDRCTLPGSPLVVLNACGTSVRDPLKTSDFVRGFMLSGGRGVVATECDVPDLFASVFVQDVYDRLLGGVPVSTALLEARRAFLKTHGNPLGLLYSAYTSIDTRVQRPGEPARPA